MRSQSKYTDLYPFVCCCFFVDLSKKEKVLVDAKVYMFGIGMAQAFFKPKELPVLKQ